MKKRNRKHNKFEGLPGRSLLSLWFHEYRNTEDQVDKRYYRNMLGRKLSILAQGKVKSYDWAPNQGDLLGAAFEGLAAAIQTFDNTKCDNFYYWAELHIKTKFGREKYSEKKWTDKAQGWEVVQQQYEDSDYLEETIPDGSLNPEEELLRRELWDVMLGCFDNVSKEILLATLGINRDSPESVRQIAKKLGISRNKVVRIQKEALVKVNKLYHAYANMAA